MTGSQPMRRAINALYHNYKFVQVRSYASAPDASFRGRELGTGRVSRDSNTVG